MQYHEAANFLFDLRRYRPSPGTESTARLLESLGNPHEGVTFVQVAGSNGKGSTARMVESILRETDRTVGLYTSPHLEDVRERVRVDGRKITREAIGSFVEAAKPHVTARAADGESPTFFETMTALALWYFGERGVDVAVLEVGIGGRYDATSVVDPMASAVTSVTLEHTGVLGETIEAIAEDKAHVAPEDAPVVTGTTGDALAAVREQAGAVVTVGSDTDADVSVQYEGRTNHTEAAISIDDDDGVVDARIPLLGEYQAVNAGIAATLAKQVTAADERPSGVPERVSATTIARGLRSAHWPGRFEVVSQGPLTVLDGAHNPGACEGLAETLSTFDYDDLHLVVGAMHDKDHRGMAAVLPTPTHCYPCEPDLDRSEDADVLGTVFGEAAETVTTRRSVASALDAALDRADPGDCVLVTGSLFAVAEARERWTRVEVPKTIRDLDDARATLSGANVTEPGVWRMRGKGVHRVLRTRVQRRQASYLKEELLSLGGECAVSGVTGNDERLDVVLMGTLAQFKRLAGKLDGQPYGLSRFADELRHALDVGTSTDASIGVHPTGDAVAGATTPADAVPDATTREPWPWADGPVIMGILNVTPDSFHDGGEYDRVADAIARAEEMVENGAGIVDVGGESTRPGADPVSVDDEIDRVVPVIEGIRDAGIDVPISIDTRKATVADAALDAGADIVNDVSGLSDPAMRFVAADHDAGLCVMHSIDTPVDPSNDVAYDDVVEDVIDQLREQVLLAEKAGIPRSDVIVDPGLGFGKTAAESFALLGRVDEFAGLNCPVLVGHSHKSMFAGIDRDDDERQAATVAGTALAVDRGADIVRVHDVDENVAALDTARAARDPARAARDPARAARDPDVVRDDDADSDA